MKHAFESRKKLRQVAVISLLILAGCGDAADDGGDDGDNGDNGSVTANNGNNGTGTSNNDPAGTTGFGGQWGGDMACAYRKESNGEVTTDQQTLPGQARFDANGDLLLAGANGQLEPQDRQGLLIEFVPEGGGTGSRELVLLQKGANTRHYEYRHLQNTTTYDSGASTTYDRRMGEVYDYTLSAGKLDVKYDLVVDTTSFFSSDAGSVNSESHEVLNCTGTLSRK